MRNMTDEDFDRLRELADKGFSMSYSHADPERVADNIERFKNILRDGISEIQQS